jgi:hypothetical protein
MGARYYHMYNERCDDGKVYIRPRMGASYYHLICYNSILHDPLYFNSFVDMAIFSISLFFLDLHVSNFFSCFSLGPSCVHIFVSIAMWRGPPLTVRLSPPRQREGQDPQREGQDWQCQGKDLGQGGERTLVKTLTDKTSSLRPVGCISDQFPTRGKASPRTTSLRLARHVSASHDKSSPRLVCGPRRTTRASPPTHTEERISTSCKIQ